MTASAGGIEASTGVFVTKKEGPPPQEPEEPPPPDEGVKNISWSGEVPAQKWMNFYTKVLSRYARENDLKLTVSFDVRPEEGVSPHRVDETKAALRELGLDDDVETG